MTPDVTPKQNDIILNVNDDPASLYSISHILRRAGFNVVEAASGKETFNKLREVAPGLIILDVNLPDMDGFEVARKIKADPATTLIPIIHLSATYRDRDAKISGLDAGAVAYLTMPVDPPMLVATVRTLLKARAAEEHVIAAAREWQATFDALSDGVALLDPEGKIIRCNKAMADIINTPADQVLGRSYRELPVHLQHRDHECPVTRMLQEPSHQASELHMGNRFFRMSVDPIIDDHGKLAGGVQIITDITALKEARMQAEAASRTKTTFLANMSHEIRTPMTAIMGMLDLLILTTHPSAEQHEYMTIMKTSADSLLNIINDILDFSRIERGKLELQHFDFSLADVIDGTLKVLAVTAHKKGIELAYAIHPEVPTNLVGDPGRLRQVIVNLVGNAIKFTEKGEVVLRIAVDKDQAHGATLRFSVADTGVGIAPERKRAIFEAFAGQEGIASPTLGGAGLGLAISSRLVTAMGGSMTVDSTPHHGSTFTFTAQFAKQAAQPPKLVVAEDMRDAPVLIVDDNAVNRRVLQDMLTYWQLKPVTVDSASAALDALKRAATAGGPFATAIIDSHMPDADGLALCRQIKERREMAETPVILITRADKPIVLENCSEAGVVACIMKPCKPSELFDATIAAIRGARMRRAGRFTYLTPAARPLRVLVAEDEESIRLLATRLLERRGHTCVTVANGKEAIERLEREHFDVILMDVRMPIMDGFTATKIIRAHEADTGAHVPIVALTAYAAGPERDSAVEYGMGGYVSKPFDPEELYEAIEAFTPAEPKEARGTS